MVSTCNNIRRFQRKLYSKSKEDLDYRFYSMYDKIYRYDILLESYQRCKSNKGKPGVDGITFSDIEKSGLKRWLLEISGSLQDRSYKPERVKRVRIPKPGGGERPLGIPTIRDRVVQMSCKIVLEPIIEARLNEGLYGYRPNRSAKECVGKVRSYLKEGYTQVYDCDLRDYFGSIPHEKLISKMRKYVTDSSMLSLLRKFLKTPVEYTLPNGRKVVEKSMQGTPQGGVISPLFANVYLNDFITLINEKTPCKAFAYADDFVIMHRSAFTGEQISWIKKLLSQEGLEVNEEKSSMVNMSMIGGEFDFLGFAFKCSTYFKNRNAKIIKVEVSKTSIKRIKDKIRNIVKHRTNLPLDELIRRLKYLVRGWRNYFYIKGMDKRIFYRLDFFMTGRFYRWSKRLSQRSSKILTPSIYGVLKQRGLEFFSAVTG